MVSPAVENALGAVPAIRGITQSYVDFTTKLVTDVMNALVSSSISQMRAYADMVASLERGLASFKGQVTTPQAIIKWLESRIPETGSDPANLKVKTDALPQASADIIRDLYATKLVTILGPAPAGVYVLPGFKKDDMASAPASVTGKTALVGAQLDATAIPNADGTGATEITKATIPKADGNGNTPIDLLSAVTTIMADDATNSYQMLDKLVQMGLLRIVVTDGHILTKMTFEMKTSDASERNSSDIYSSAFAASTSASAGWGPFSASARASYSTFNVRVANEHSQTSTEIFTTMMGEVLINYRSDFFPSLPSQAKP